MSDKSTAFPSELTNPAQKKEKAWILQYIKAAWQDFNSTFPNGFYNSRNQLHTTKLYVAGKQPIAKYKKVLLVEDEANKDDSWMRINWDILPIIPKFIRIGLAVLNKAANFEITAHAVDALAMDDQKKYYAEAAAKIQLRDAFRQNGLDPKLIHMDEQFPQTMEELEMHMKYSYKHRFAIEIETAIDLIFKNNKFSDIEKLVRRDLLIAGIGCAREYFESDGEIAIERVAPEDLIVGYSDKADFSDSRYQGQVKLMTIGELKQVAKDQFTKEQYQEIADLVEGQYRNSKNKSWGSTKFSSTHDGYKFRVVDLEWLSNNTVISEEKTNKYGNMLYSRVAPEKAGKNSKTHNADYDVVYKGKWIVGTDFCFDYGLETNMKRDPAALKKTSTSYHIIAPEMYDMTTNSLASQVEGIADQIQLAWYRLQNIIARARPKGAAINLTALEDVIMSGKLMETEKLVSIFNTTGNVLYRSENEEGEESRPPIMELDNGMGDDADNCFKIIAQNVNLLRDILGFNEITDGSTPDPRTLKTVAQLATMSTNNSLHFITDAENNIKERIARNVVLRIQDMALDGTLKIYHKALGQNTIDFFKIEPEVAYHQIGITLEALPTDQDREKLARRVEIALQSNPAQITVADATAIESIKNIKMAWEYLSFRVRKKQEQDLADAMQRQKANAEDQQISAKVAEEEKRKTMAAKAEVDIQVKAAEHDLKMKFLEREKELEFQIEQMKATGKFSQTALETSTKEKIADRQNSLQQAEK